MSRGLSLCQFLGLSVLDLGPMYSTRQTDRHQMKALLTAPPIRGGA